MVYIPYNRGHMYSKECPCLECKEIRFWDKFRTDPVRRRDVFARVNEKLNGYAPTWWDKIKLFNDDDKYKLWFFREHILKPMAREAGDNV
jgi:hypothetical protein